MAAGRPPRAPGPRPAHGVLRSGGTAQAGTAGAGSGGHRSGSAGTAAAGTATAGVAAARDLHGLAALGVGAIGRVDPADVLAGSPSDETVPQAIDGVQAVGAAPSEESIPAGPSRESVPATTALDSVVAAAGFDHVCLRGTHEPVRPLRAEHPLSLRGPRQREDQRRKDGDHQSRSVNSHVSDSVRSAHIAANGHPRPRLP